MFFLKGCFCAPRAKRLFFSSLRRGEFLRCSHGAFRVSELSEERGFSPPQKKERSFRREGPVFFSRGAVVAPRRRQKFSPKRGDFLRCSHGAFRVLELSGERGFSPQKTERSFRREAHVFFSRGAVVGTRRRQKFSPKRGFWGRFLKKN